MNLSIYQLFLMILAMTFIYINVSNFVSKKNYYSFLKFFLFMGIWGGVLMFSIFPELAHSITEFIGAGENLNTIIFSGFVLIFIIIFKLLSIIERIERDITKIIRENAMEKVNHKDNK